ncbi:redoxin domain-containing protein [Chitinophaga sp. SYP-B3965]|uniref:TlpA disulfide reductase family protein n=1 Tax=Chitinophaga sp. SYP-B3965 TaxID=2663120 RepID=UPI001299C941|nr:TlpA disulfide reductase family protein [Chitinophaga sp. SYP-B3965]MRG47669.1 redoxin domain-containing protein [Chitinophaga sp. SYP-B3965]
MHKLLLTLLALPSFVVAQQTVTIKGKFSGDTKGYNKVYIYGTGVKNDSSVMTDGNFEFKVPFEKPFLPLFYTEYDKTVKRMYSPYPVLVEQPGEITLSEGDITKGMASFKVSGQKSAEDFSDLRTQQNAVYKKVNDKISAKFGDKWYDRSNPKADEIGKEREKLTGEEMAIVLNDFIGSHPDSYASALALSMGRSSLKTEDMEKLYAKLSPKGKQTEEGKNVADYLNGLKSSAIGSTVKDFSLNTPDEKLLSFASLKGKYVMIDFWASWCGPCKQSFPHMKEVYAKYKSDKFEIYSISIDKDKAAWLKGLKEQDLPWLQTLDTKNISQSGFAVTGVPTTYLIDPKGKILMKEVGFEPGGNSPLEKKLVELFGAK